jgi:hypothetical protein
MKKSLLKRLTTVVLIITVLTACNSNHQKQITGTWQVVDAKFESKSPIDPEMQSYYTTEMKSWVYTFNADSTMNVKQVDKDVPNRWKLNEKGDSIIIGFGTGFFDVASKIEKLTDNELVMRTTQGVDTAKVTQILYLKKTTK